MSNETIGKIELAVVFCAEAGQGLSTIENLLVKILPKLGFYLFSTKENMSRIRGGCDSTSIRIANYPIAAPVDRIDILFPFINEAFSHLEKRISEQTLVISDLEKAPKKYNNFSPNFEEIVKELGDKIYENVITVGFLFGLLHIDPQIFHVELESYFQGKTKEVIESNVKAATKGCERAKDLLAADKLKYKIPGNTTIKNQIILTGSEAIALGALAGGCNFISSYPMSPSTGVLIALAKHSLKFDIVVEQAEDEIAAINMGLGAWYAGARAIATTSGGGFALMCEGLSLAGITETPMVILLGQRPGPATGLPTRTEQGDLNLALYAGHGEFLRIIFAPGSLQQAFALAEKAFYLADKYQVPVIILADQYLLDSYALTPKFDFKNENDTKKFIIKTDKDYKRYRITADGVSPRGIPDYGDGIVCVDSDEHTEDGYITENFDVRNAMVEKRLRKLVGYEKEIIEPDFVGKQGYQFLIVSWGSNYQNIIEALEKINNDTLAFLHFSQVYPLPKKCADYFATAKKIIVIENNATGQFAKLLHQYFNVQTNDLILKYNGLPFTVEELTTKIKEKLG